MTNLTATQIAQLTTIITGGVCKRSATKGAAIKRFIAACNKDAPRPIDAEIILAISNFDEAKDALLSELKAENETNKADAKSKRKAAVALAAAASEKNKPAVAKEDRPAFRDPAKVQEIMLDLIGTVGPGKVGKFRAAWIDRDPNGYGKLAPTQQRGIMRKAINKLVASGLVVRDGSTFSLAERKAKKAA
jgi:hypothetical protein